MCQLLRELYEGLGKTVQFHANTTYENFIGGLAPIHANSDAGFAIRAEGGIPDGKLRQRR
jgi:5-methylcytosine-specific restriction protein B